MFTRIVGAGQARIVALWAHIYSVGAFLRIIFLSLGTNFETGNTIKRLRIISTRTWHFIIKQWLRWLRLSKSFIHLDFLRCSVIQAQHFILSRSNIDILTSRRNRLWELIARICCLTSSLMNLSKISAGSRITPRNVNKALTLRLPSTVLFTIFISVVLFKWTFYVVKFIRFLRLPKILTCSFKVVLAFTLLTFLSQMLRI